MTTTSNPLAPFASVREIEQFVEWVHEYRAICPDLTQEQAIAEVWNGGDFVTFAAENDLAAPEA